MSEEQTAQAEEKVLDAPEEQVAENEPEVEPAETAPEQTPAEIAIQKRINRAVAKQNAEKRRADEAERKLSEFQSTKTAPDAAPKIEDFDHDEVKYQDALIDYRVSKAVNSHSETQAEEQRKLSAQADQETFNGRISAFDKPDFAEAAQAVPDLPNGVAAALVQAENGPEIIYHLGKNLDIADKLAGMTPNMAMMEIGRISATMNTKPPVKLTSAPEPIEPVSSGGSLSTKRGPKGAIYA